MFHAPSRRLLPAVTLAVLCTAVIAVVSAENIDPNEDNSQFAWGENVGWINAEPSGNGGFGMQVSGPKITGYMYGENIGWINLHCENNNTCGNVQYGVTNDNLGNLGGYAWGENVGWISFCDQDVPGACNVGGASTYRVTIDPETGIFSGYAWGENIGWISFFDDAPVAYQIQFSDADAVDNIDDNCPFDMNPAQTNTDSGPPPPAGNVGAIGNGVFLPGDDVTVPGGDVYGDACDLDSDNDGLPDTIDPEPGLPRDLTVDDDGDGNAAVGCFGGTDPDDDGVSWDMDCDGKLDGAPADCGSVTLDADGDGLRDAWETCRWGTSNSSVDSDGDGIGDCTEAFDVNGNSLVNSADATFVVQAVFNVNPRDWAFDMNGNGNITIADAVFIWQAVFNVITCL
jgi:hypothetical protein